MQINPSNSGRYETFTVGRFPFHKIYFVASDSPNIEGFTLSLYDPVGDTVVLRPIKANLPDMASVMETIRRHYEATKDEK